LVVVFIFIVIIFMCSWLWFSWCAPIHDHFCDFLIHWKLNYWWCLGASHFHLLFLPFTIGVSEPHSCFYYDLLCVLGCSQVHMVLTNFLLLCFVK
jgi:hypothetical protein